MPIDIFLNQTVAIKSATGFDINGKPTVGSSSTIEARIQANDKKMFDENKREYMVDAVLYVKPSQTIANDDLVTYDGNNYRVVRVDTKRGIYGSKHHKRCMLVRTKNS